MVKVRDECTKNYKEVDQPINNAVMVENKEDWQCPVQSFKLYMSHLHPDNEYMLQAPNLHPKQRNSEICYTRGHLGKTPLGCFISELSTKVGTSKHYTNHCVQVSTTNIVTKSGKFNDKETMDLTGHKSLQSLNTYCRVSQKRKMELVKELKSIINKTQEELGQEKVKKKTKGPTSTDT